MSIFGYFEIHFSQSGPAIPGFGFCHFPLSPKEETGQEAANNPTATSSPAGDEANTILRAAPGNKRHHRARGLGQVGFRLHEAKAERFSMASAIGHFRHR